MHAASDLNGDTSRASYRVRVAAIAAHAPAAEVEDIVDREPIRRLPVGAEVQRSGGAHFRVWAPARRRVELVLEDARGATALELRREARGYFSLHVPDARAGTRYRFRLDGASALYPDPASRQQPDGPEGPSCVVDPSRFRWTDGAWRGVELAGQVLYELHVGTFTREGTYRAAERELPALRAAGVTVLELMPVAEFPGRFGWGYDGVDLFAPTRLYGAPDELRHFIDAAHAHGLGVILDVVYNHLGPAGNYLKQFAPGYFSTRHTTEWGEAINFDGEDAAPVREFFVANAGYWIDEFHFDGLRLDATQCVFDDSPGEHVLAEITRRVRSAAGARRAIVVAENEPQLARLARPIEQDGYGLDALWNDDFHHSAVVALTDRAPAYYSDHRGSAQELLSAIKHGYLFQGQRYRWQKQRRGAPALDLPPAAFVLYTENHDQVANSAAGLRLHQLTSPGRARAMAALLLLAPGTPMLFQGQEYGSSKPFLYFADHAPDLAALVRKGRGEFLTQFPNIAVDAVRARLDDPGDERTFERCKLDPAERAANAAVLALHTDLLRLRRADPVFAAQRWRGVDGAVLAADALVLRYFGERGDDRLVLVNLGRDLELTAAPEPLLAPPSGLRWRLAIHTEDPKYGGLGGPHPEADDTWRLQGAAAAVLTPEPSGPVAGNRQERSR